jgi:two-component system alkaline phosphatase synthesis response regulator PhoP
MMQKVMLVEDDATMIGLLNILLEMEGFGVVKMLEDDPDKILETIRKEQPVVILMDVHLRQSNGLDLLRRIKGEEDTKASKILMSSGIDFREECTKAGADGFILKPYMPDALIQQIRQLAA